MSKLGTNQIRELARRIVASRPGGIRYSELIQEISRQSPETPVNTVHGCTWDLAIRFPAEIIKPSRGLFKPASAQSENSATMASTEGESAPGYSEDAFYEPFAEWLKNDLDEVTAVSSLGGAGLKTKWGTPDVVGVYKPIASNLIKFPLEIVSAEIKISPQAPVVAFGQAVAYRLFSTKTYVVMPSSLSEEDLSRLESLCMLFGIGLAIFDLNLENPAFSIRVRAQRYLPDMFYVNEFADRLRQHDNEVFEHLFS
ncbi:MAG: hypothetical protein ACP5QA_14180 [Phycisphaerae bacterium]